MDKFVCMYRLKHMHTLTLYFHTKEIYRLHYILQSTLNVNYHNIVCAYLQNPTINQVAFLKAFEEFKYCHHELEQLGRSTLLDARPVMDSTILFMLMEIGSYTDSTKLRSTVHIMCIFAFLFNICIIV